VVGKTPLRRLPELLRASALYVGNNSGPKHIAGALGVPTIGIHSGVVDAIEWGPIGERAVALRRNMACSPCYLARLEDCPRNFACMRGLEPTVVQEVSEIFLSRPVDRRVVPPFVEPELEIASPSPVKAKRRRKTSDASEEPVAQTEQPAPEAKPKRTRRRQVSPIQAD
jgi:hypothetical protein